MKRNNDYMVKVMKRQGADLIKLTSNDSTLMVACGTIGKNIAIKVREGNGQALIPLSHIRDAVDTMDGVNALLDNFDLSDPTTRAPLLFALLNDI